MLTGSAGSPTVATMAAPPAVVPPVADPSVYVVTWAFVSRINCKLRFTVIAYYGYTSQEPLLAQGQSIGLGGVFLRLVFWAAPLSGFGQPSACTMRTSQHPPSHVSFLAVYSSFVCSQ